jgi:hypothetical protein
MIKRRRPRLVRVNRLEHLLDTPGKSPIASQMGQLVGLRPVEPSAEPSI